MEYPLDPRSYKMLDKIGAGPTSVVYKAECFPKNSTVAVKSIDLDQSGGNSETNTISPSTLLSGGHPNILQLHGLFTSGRRLWVVMPYMSAGSLKSIISSSAFPDGLPEPIIAEVLKETLNAVSFLHNQGRSIGKIKTGNILIGSNGDVKLADFGIYKLGTSKDVSFSSSDIWSFGITAMELALGRSPRFRSSNFEKHENSKNKKLLFSKDFKDMVASCLNQDPSKRPSAGDLLNHCFFKNCKGADFIVKNLLQGLPTIEERFKQSGACAATGEDNDYGLKGQIANICGWNFDEDEFELVPIFATEPPQKPDDETVVQMVRIGGETIIPDEKLESGGSDLNALGRVGDEALVGAEDLVVDGNQRDRMLDGLIRLRRSLDEQRLHVINLINVLGGEVSSDDVQMLLNENLRMDLDDEKEKNHRLELELEILKLLISGAAGAE